MSGGWSSKRSSREERHPRARGRIARQARTILAGDGVTADFPVMRHMANLESVITYEGTEEIQTLVVGAALTGLRAFE